MQLPKRGTAHADVISQIEQAKKGDADWQGARTFSLIYPAGEDVDGLLRDANLQYLYENGGQFCFMNENTYEQVILSSDDLGDQVKYLIPEVVVSMEFHDGKPVGVELPTTVDLKVTRTDPGLKGATATNKPKPATLETGLVIQVPQFVNEEDVVRVETATGKYLTRAKD